MKESRLATETAEFNLVIASDSSRFKDSLRKRLIARYKNQFNIDVVNVRKLKKLRAEEYDVILIMDTCFFMTGLNHSLKSFVKRQKDHNKTVLFMTSEEPDWQYRYQGIDAITSASLIENEEAIYSEISERIDAIVSGR